MSIREGLQSSQILLIDKTLSLGLSFVFSLSLICVANHEFSLSKQLGRITKGTMTSKRATKKDIEELSRHKVQKLLRRLAQDGSSRKRKRVGESLSQVSTSTLSKVITSSTAITNSALVTVVTRIPLTVSLPLPSTITFSLVSSLYKQQKLNSQT